MKINALALSLLIAFAAPALCQEPKPAEKPPAGKPEEKPDPSSKFVPAAQAARWQ